MVRAELLVIRACSNNSGHEVGPTLERTYFSCRATQTHSNWNNLGTLVHLSAHLWDKGGNWSPRRKPMETWENIRKLLTDSGPNKNYFFLINNIINDIEQNYPIQGPVVSILDIYILKSDLLRLHLMIEVDSGNVGIAHMDECVNGGARWRWGIGISAHLQLAVGYAQSPPPWYSKVWFANQQQQPHLGYRIRNTPSQTWWIKICILIKIWHNPYAHRSFRNTVLSGFQIMHLGCKP